MTTLSELTDEVRDHSSECAPGSECQIWQDYVAECYDLLGCAPWGADRTLPTGFAAAWRECLQTPYCPDAEVDDSYPAGCCDGMSVDYYCPRCGR